MTSIRVKKEKNMKDSWLFLVVVGDENDKTEHLVTLDKSYWEVLTVDSLGPEELVRRSFKFLLEREPKESILKEFNLRIINNYFPNYEQEIKK